MCVMWRNKSWNRKESRGYCINLQMGHRTKTENLEEKAEGGVVIKSQVKNDLFLPTTEIDYYPADCRETLAPFQQQGDKTRFITSY